MKNEDQFSVVVVNGDFFDAWEIGTDALRYDGLTWEQSVELARLSFSQGFQVVLWKVDDGEE